MLYRTWVNPFLMAGFLALTLTACGSGDKKADESTGGEQAGHTALDNPTDSIAAAKGGAVGGATTLVEHDGSVLSHDGEAAAGKNADDEASDDDDDDPSMADDDEGDDPSMTDDEVAGEAGGYQSGDEAAVATSTGEANQSTVGAGATSDVDAAKQKPEDTSVTSEGGSEDGKKDDNAVSVPSSSNGVSQ